MADLTIDAVDKALRRFIREVQDLRALYLHSAVLRCTKPRPPKFWRDGLSRFGIAFGDPLGEVMWVFLSGMGKASQTYSLSAAYEPPHWLVDWCVDAAPGPAKTLCIIRSLERARAWCVRARRGIERAQAEALRSTGLRSIVELEADVRAAWMGYADAVMQLRRAYLQSAAAGSQKGIPPELTIPGDLSNELKALGIGLSEPLERLWPSTACFFWEDWTGQSVYMGWDADRPPLDKLSRYTIRAAGTVKRVRRVLALLEELRQWAQQLSWR